MEEYGCSSCNYEGTPSADFPCNKCTHDEDKPSRWQEKKDENVDHPAHYSGNIECIDAMLQCFGKEAVFYFCLLNAYKYNWRCMQKHETPIEDIKKASWYQNMAINLWEEMKA